MTRVVSQLLHELDGVTELKRVVVVAATNRPDILDPAFLRPGRIDRLLYVGPPDEKSRAQIITQQVRTLPFPCRLSSCRPVLFVLSSPCVSL